MKFKEFYASCPEANILNHLDEAYEKKMHALIRELDRGEWTENQKKRQKSSILPNIALYKVFMEYGIEKGRARELVRERAYERAGKLHNILKSFFRIPGFPKAFRHLMNKGMKSGEIWKSEVLSDDAASYAVDIHKCLWADTCAYFGCPELCEVFCLSDHIVFGNIDKMEFQRSETLGMAGNKCDFHFYFKEKAK
ncbi:MAG: L-2-amino-thiazoline-4-carboxylic acid hydrolase [Johnsonella sp.]|nr:L-2-amino-thiazoline-4-carboxylic acid hydrolase [Johnsonella sp.]